MRLDGYVRVSQVRGRGGESFISPAQQRDRIRAWASAYGHEIVEVHEELDESGARRDRPLLERAIGRVEAGDVDGIVVARLDRWGRSLVDGIAQIDRVQRAGGAFVSVQDGFDLTTDTGRLVMQIMLALAEHELNRVRANWDDARRRAIRRGLHMATIVPFGYRRRDDRRLEPDPDTAPLVVGLFERRAAGESWASIGRWLGVSGATTAGWGRSTWSLRGMRDIIRSDVYLGVASHGEFRNENAHDAIVDRLLWQRAQRRGTIPVALSATPPLLAGVLRCAGCRYVMRAGRYRLASGEVAVHYRCRSSSGGGWVCEAPAAISSRSGVEKLVTGVFLDGIPDMEARAVRRSPRLAELEHERDDARGIFEEWRDDRRAQQLGVDDFMAGLEVRKGDLDAADDRLARARRDADAVELPVPAVELRGLWSDLEVAERRELLAAAFECAFVAAGSGPVAERVRVLWRGQRVDLPGRGRRDYRPRPFTFDE